MDMTIRPVSAVPTHVMDTRPTADAAALARDPRPDLPLPIPAGLGQTAATLSASLVTAFGEAEGGNPARRATIVEPVERTLKPWGVTMLPDEAARRAAAERAREAAETAEDAAATEARAAADSREAAAAAEAAEQAEAALDSAQTASQTASPSAATMPAGPAESAPDTAF